MDFNNVIETKDGGNGDHDSYRAVEGHCNRSMTTYKTIYISF